MGRLIKEFVIGATFVAMVFTIILVSFMIPPANAQSKAKFYDFQDQIIEGELKRPTTLYTDARKKVKFERLLKLKKSFMYDLYNSAKDRIFK